MRIRIRSDPVIFGPPDPDPVIFSTDPDPGPTCNNGFIKLFLSWTKYKSESTNSSLNWWVIISNFIPTYLKYKNIFFLISISGRIRIRNFFSAEPDPDPWKKIPDPHPWEKETCCVNCPHPQFYIKEYYTQYFKGENFWYVIWWIVHAEGTDDIIILDPEKSFLWWMKKMKGGGGLRSIYFLMRLVLFSKIGHNFLLM